MKTHVTLVLLVASACALRPAGDSAASASGTTGATDDDSGAGVTTGDGTLVTGGTGSTSGGTSGATSTVGPELPTTGADTGADTTSSFITPPDGGGGTKGCDPWVQDCPEGQKCMPWSGDGDNAWESLKCVDVVPGPDGLYEPCGVIDSPVSGEDTCDVGLMCWDVVDGVGRCLGMCIGSPDAPGCADPTAQCIISGDGVLTLCLPQCHPLEQDCLHDDLCIPNPQNQESFLCVLDASGEEGQVFDPCEYANACDPGLYCVEPSLGDECDPMAGGCCLPFCDTTLANTCAGQGQECLPWFEQGMAPPGLANVGICGVPS